MKNIVEINNISVDYLLKKYSIRAVNKVSLNIVEGKITALVGESGSGKTILANILLKNLSDPGKLEEGEILYFGNENIVVINQLFGNNLQKFRWAEISMVFQGAQNALNPLMTIFEQFYETLLVHRPKINKDEAKKISTHYLNLVNLDPEKVFSAYPHELSGGMKQRVMIAFSLLLEPKLIILDEPTTALDVIVQDYIFKLLKKINVDLRISMLLLTHDISVVSKYADFVAVMYGSKMMEYGTVKDVFTMQLHPYTKGLINATPSLGKDISLMKTIPGSPANLMFLPSGCVFNPRCEKAWDLCKSHEPGYYKYPDETHVIRCHLYSEGGK